MNRYMTKNLFLNSSIKTTFANIEKNTDYVTEYGGTRHYRFLIRKENVKGTLGLLNLDLLPQ